MWRSIVFSVLYRVLRQPDLIVNYLLLDTRRRLLSRRGKADGNLSIQVHGKIGAYAKSTYLIHLIL